MSFDQKTRNALAKIVGDSRRVLHADLVEQLQGVYGLQPDGSVLNIDQLTHLRPDDQQLAIALRAWQAHLATNGTEATESLRLAAAFQRMAHEASFTTLNRLAAIRMAEVRGIVIESVGKGSASDGFRLFESLAGGGLGDRDDAYAVYLGLLFDELAVELGVLFERRTPAGRLFPRPPALASVLELLDAPHIAPLWVEDETIGWIYQYFNSKEERDAMRKASAAPRNSRELAVRNQFFTPRDVVEFLTDNTLGRLWYEIRRGDTRLVDECAYLIRRPTEVFLAPGESLPPGADESSGEHTFEDLVNAPTYVPHRPRKDPRDLRVLDPAVGSGHFLLRAYDLLEIIYEEAWADPESLPFAGRTLAEDFATLEDLGRALPDLIIRHNLHGIDIDPRASQIAGLALWLRAQRAFMRMDLSASERPTIRRSNIVTAEPMPGDDDLIKEFAAELHPKVLGDLVRVVWERMNLAGEAGSLLRIDVELQAAITEARHQWQRQPQTEQLDLFEGSRPRPLQAGLFDVSGISDSRFWDEAEGSVVDALNAYTEHATTQTATARRLFADDALEGFAFIELCRKLYDVVLMNPPFGLAPRPVYEYLTRSYPNAYSDLALAFMDRGLRLAPGGRVGAITSRAFLTVADAQSFRRETALHKLEMLVDLGSGVMDGALVDASAQVLADRASSPCLIADLRDRSSWDDFSVWARTWERSPRSRLVFLGHFGGTAGARIAYDQAPGSAALLAAEGEGLDPVEALARTGGSTFEDVRFLRLRWEPLPQSVGLDATWAPLGRNVPEFSPYYYPSEVVVKWNREGRELQARNELVNGQTAQARQGSSHYGRPGLIFGRRSSPTIALRAHPAGCTFSSTSGLVMPRDPEQSMALLAYLNSGPVRGLLTTLTTRQSYTVGHIRALAPMPASIARELGSRAEAIVEAKRVAFSRLETDPLATPWSSVGHMSLREIALSESTRNESTKALLRRLAGEIDDIVKRALAMSSSDEMAQHQANPDDIARAAILDDSSPASVARRLLSFAVGCAFGRWDVRLGIAGAPTPPLTGPFDALPQVPPGGLIGPVGGPWNEELTLSSTVTVASQPPDSAPGPYPGETSTTEASYPMQVAWPGILAYDATDDGAESDDDLVVRVRAVFAVLWPSLDGAAADAIEAEACELLNVRSLGEYFRRPAGFFANHLATYSKSRRQAPIYWPLSTKTGLFTLWFYYPQLSEDLLYRAVTDHIDPRIAEVERGIESIDRQLSLSLVRDATSLRVKLDRLRDLRSELVEMRGELLRVASLPYRPSHDDGVVISAAPLHDLFRLPKWRTDLEECWHQLQAGDYDWSHLALGIWPDRVRDTCRRDRSVAIAHDLEVLYKGSAPAPRRSSGQSGSATTAEQE